MSQSRLEPIVRQFDLLLESLVGGAPEDRAAIWGQAEQESNFNPAAIEKPGTSIGGIGLWQHTGPRRRELEAFAAAHGKPWQDIETQVRFVGHELTGAYAHAWHQITRIATTLRAKVETAMALFEAPAGWQQEIQNPGSTTAGLKRRLQGAVWALAVIMAAKKGDRKVTDTSGVTSTAPAPAAQPVDQLAAFIKAKELQVEDLIKAFVLAKWPFIPGFAIDLVFKEVNQVDLVSMAEHVDWGAVIGKLFKKQA